MFDQSERPSPGVLVVGSLPSPRPHGPAPRLMTGARRSAWARLIATPAAKNRGLPSRRRAAIGLPRELPPCRTMMAVLEEPVRCSSSALPRPPPQNTTTPGPPLPTTLQSVPAQGTSTCCGSQLVGDPAAQKSSPACLCDLTAGACDDGCCCDLDCSFDSLKLDGIFGCKSNGTVAQPTGYTMCSDQLVAANIPQSCKSRAWSPHLAALTACFASSPTIRPPAAPSSAIRWRRPR